MIFRNVDLPSPLAPINPTCSPFNKRNDASSKICRAPKPWVTFETVKTLISISTGIKAVLLKTACFILT